MNNFSAWWTQPLRVAPSARLLAIGEQQVLFSEKLQQLFELNESASVIWSGIASGLSCAEIVNHLAQGDAARVEAFVNSAAQEWLANGFLAPESVFAAGTSAPSTELRLRIGDFRADLKTYGDANAAALEATFGHLTASVAAPADTVVSIVGVGDNDFLLHDEQLLGMAPRNETTPRIKALLTEAVCDSVKSGFLTHGALISRNEKTVLLSGAPGAGKTTLTLALCASGFAYGGDDIVRISRDGRAEGIPFAAAAKTGSWPLLGGYELGIEKLDVHKRTDGQITRYVTPSQLDRGGARDIDIILSLQRKESVEANIEPMTPLAAFCMLIESGYSGHSTLDGDLAKDLADTVSKAKCGRLVYNDLSAAVALIKALTE